MKKRTIKKGRTVDRMINERKKGILVAILWQDYCKKIIFAKTLKHWTRRKVTENWPRPTSGLTASRWKVHPGFLRLHQATAAGVHAL